jgi:hypothetical protein
VIHEGCEICFLRLIWEGKATAISVAKLASHALPPGNCLHQGKGFQGFRWSEVTIFQPKKKTRLGQLTPPELATDREISSIRVQIERARGGVKRDRIVKDTIHLLKDGILDAVIKTCSGLHHFRLWYRTWNYAR